MVLPQDVVAFLVFALEQADRWAGIHDRNDPVAPAQVRISHIYRGITPFVLIQLLTVGLIAAFPIIATWLPDLLDARNGLR